MQKVRAHRPSSNGLWWKRNGKADEPATEGASLHGAVTAEHYARDVKQAGMEVHATVEYAAHKHARVGNWKDRHEIIPNTREM